MNMNHSIILMIAASARSILECVDISIPLRLPNGEPWRLLFVHDFAFIRASPRCFFPRLRSQVSPASWQCGYWHPLPQSALNIIVARSRRCLYCIFKALLSLCCSESKVRRTLLVDKGCLLIVAWSWLRIRGGPQEVRSALIFAYL